MKTPSSSKHPLIIKMAKKTIRKLSVSEKMLVILDAKHSTASKIARKANCTYSHANKSLMELRGAGLVKLVNPNSSTRDKHLMLTEKGIRARDLLRELNEIYNG